MRAKLICGDITQAVGGTAMFTTDIPNALRIGVVLKCGNMRRDYTVWASFKSVDLEIVQIFRHIHAYLSFHIYPSDILLFFFLMHVTSKRGPYSFM